MSLHSILTFHVVTQAAPHSARKRQADSAEPSISAAWEATAEALRASLREKSESEVEIEST